MARYSSNLHEVWSRCEDGEARMHGAALGLTFEDACKQLATESIDFWTHYDRGHYRGRRLYPTRGQALSADEAG